MGMISFSLLYWHFSLGLHRGLHLPLFHERCNAAKLLLLGASLGWLVVGTLTLDPHLRWLLHLTMLSSTPFSQLFTEDNTGVLWITNNVWYSLVRQVFEYHPAPWDKWMTIGYLQKARGVDAFLSIGPEQLSCLSGGKIKFWSRSIFNYFGMIWRFQTSPECPLQRPTPGHLCAAPSGAMECQYPADHCCCGQCFKSLNFSCVTDSVTGTGIWQTTPVCPEEGCGSQGERQCTRSMCCS